MRIKGGKKGKEDPILVIVQNNYTEQQLGNLSTCRLTTAECWVNWEGRTEDAFETSVEIPKYP